MSESSRVRVTGTSIDGKAVEAVLRKIAAPRIADQHGGAPFAQGKQPLDDPRGEVLLVADVAGEHRVPAAILPTMSAWSAVTDTPLAGGIDADGRDGEGIDVAGGHLGRAGLHGGDGDEPEPEAKSSTRLPRTVSGWSRM